MKHETEQEIIRRAMSIMGSRKSARKTRACRANAKRPRKRKKHVSRKRVPS